MRNTSSYIWNFNSKNNIALGRYPVACCGEYSLPNELSRNSKDDYTLEEALMIDKMHKEKIKLSDAILVVNVNGYIGSSTKSEIEYAKNLNKEIMYYTDLKEE